MTTTFQTRKPRTAPSQTADAGGDNPFAANVEPAPVTDELPWEAPVMPPAKPAARTLLAELGHSEACVETAMAGRIARCSCHTRTMDDPAVAVGMALHFGKAALTRGLPIPRNILLLLTERVEEGDPASALVARWLDEHGLLGGYGQAADSCTAMLEGGQ